MNLAAFQHWKMVGYLVGAIVVFGLVLFTLDRCGSWSDTRGNEKAKEEIKQGLANIEAKQKEIANLQTEVAVEKEKVKERTEDYLSATNATDQARAEANAALANMEAAKNANTANTSVKELEQLLEKLK